MSAEHVVSEQSIFAYQTCKLFVGVQGFYSYEAIFSSWHQTGRAKEKPIGQKEHELCFTRRLYEASSKATNLPKCFFLSPGKGSSVSCWKAAPPGLGLALRDPRHSEVTVSWSHRCGKEGTAEEMPAGFTVAVEKQFREKWYTPSPSVPAVPATSSALFTNIYSGSFANLRSFICDKFKILNPF